MAIKYDNFIPNSISLNFMPPPSQKFRYPSNAKAVILIEQVKAN